jgi:hypothetical protein
VGAVYVCVLVECKSERGCALVFMDACECEGRSVCVWRVSSECARPDVTVATCTRAARMRACVLACVRACVSDRVYGRVSSEQGVAAGVATVVCRRPVR